MASSRPTRRLLAVSYHSLFDHGSGAALSLRDLLQLLGRRDWECRTLTGPVVDLAGRPTLRDRLAGELDGFRIIEAGTSRVCHRRDAAGTHVAFEPATGAVWPTPVGEIVPFVQLMIRAIHRWRPDVVLTYGGTWVGRSLISAAKVMGRPVVFWLRNCSYGDPRFFAPVDGVIVPCQFAANWYRQRLGLDTIPIRSPVIAETVRCSEIDRRYVTFVNPQWAKGVAFFAELFRRISVLRPDIPLLVVEGRAGTASLDATIPDWRTRPNLKVIPATTDPRVFYSVSRLVLMPSLWEETFSRVPVEAFINGIPVLASDRGGLPENCRRAGLALEIPGRWTPSFAGSATDEELRPWLDALLGLWDDPDRYDAESARCRVAAEEFSEDRLGARYGEAFQSLASAPIKPFAGTPERILAMLTNQAGPAAQPLLDDAALDAMLDPQ